ncbi:hypothetical protein AVEN_269001-1 [Araneus ventricosus]|uniref:Uncharacterized protein n=1 Tax=Araneus ventricosus TaxID=182803 RepID=A0A4Y2UWT1_ARAVE|nr:hypothetical protein AVEN_269001-1 [Araneus ventricosus]
MRSQTRAVEKEIAEKESDSSEIIVEENGLNKTENAFQFEPDSEVIKIPDLNNESEKLTLPEINREEFKRSQHDSSNLRNRAGVKPIGPIAPNRAPRLRGPALACYKE